MDRQKWPFVSIIIPVFNEERHIGRCLKDVFSQDYPKEKMEVLVMDGMSRDGTRQVAQRFPVRVLDNPRHQRVFALNSGIKNAKGEIVVRIDARTLIPENYVRKCVETLLETGADNVGGVQKPIFGGDIMQKAIGLASCHPFGVGGAEFRLGIKSGYVDSAYLGCFKKEVFDKVGLFDEEAPIMTEDADINWRIKKSGGKVYLNKDIIAHYIPRANLLALWRLYFRYGGARAGFFLKHKVLRWRQVLPTIYLFALLFSVIALTGNYITNYAVNYIILFFPAVLAGLYLTADLFPSIVIALRQKDVRFFLPLVLVFPCMHFSWAAGFVWRMMQRPRPGTYWGH